MKKPHITKTTTETREKILIFCAACLLFIWPLPETMAFRNLLLVIGLIASTSIIFKKENSTARNLKATTPLFLFFTWVIVHFIFLVNLKSEQYQELTGFWLRSFACLVIGTGLGVTITDIKANAQSKNRAWETLLVVGLFGTFSIYLARYAVEIFTSGKLMHTNFYMTPFKGKPQIIVFLSILISLLYTKLSQIIDGKERTYWVYISLTGITLSLFIFYTANTKNGFLIFAIISTIFMAKVARQNLKNPKNLVIFMLALIPLTYFGQKHIESNPAWRMLPADIQVGMDIENQKYWRNWLEEKAPINSQGVEVNPSTYLRTAWFVAATQLIHENPLGYGLMSYSFTYLAEKKWPDFYTQNGEHKVATHSGWIDLTLAFGIPGISLLLFSLGLSFVRAFRSHAFWNVYAIWTIPVILVTYLTVEISFDIFYELLFLLAGFFAILTGKRA